MSILVTGGAGFIGSHTCVELLNAGYDVVVADNLYNASEKSLERVKKITGKDLKFYKADIRDKEAMNEIFEKEEIESVIHFAGLKACAEEKENTLLHILSLRLRYPVSLTDEAKERYVAHLREQELYIIPKLVGQKNMERITFFCENGWITQAAVKAGLEQASRMEWAEGTAELLHLQRKYFTEQKKERYSFDELW